jgi:plastocyanin
MRKAILTLLALAALVAASLALAAAGGAVTGRAARSKTVRLTANNTFKPKSIRIGRGTTVKWVWRGGFHNVTGRRFHSRTTARVGATYRHKFRRRGTFRIVCTIHQTIGMKMTVRVR